MEINTDQCKMMKGQDKSGENNISSPHGRVRVIVHNLTGKKHGKKSLQLTINARVNQCKGQPQNNLYGLVQRTGLVYPCMEQDQGKPAVP